MDVLERMAELKVQGFLYSQILFIMGMELRGSENPDLVRGTQGLARGLGYSGEIYGSLTGGACLLGLYAGKGLPEEEEEPKLDFIAGDLVKWFKQEYQQVYGGIRCDDILGGRNINMAARCPAIVGATYQRVKELLVENGFDLSRMDGSAI
jgi:hypothetical protein